MTAKANMARSDKIEFNVAMIVREHSGKLDMINAVAEQGGFLVTFDATIKSVRSRVRTVCGTAAGLASLKGVVKGGTAYASQSHATTDAAATEFEWAIADSVVPAGEVLYWAGDGGATGTGDVDCVVVLVPRGQ